MAHSFKNEHTKPVIVINSKQCYILPQVSPILMNCVCVYNLTLLYLHDEKNTQYIVRNIQLACETKSRPRRYSSKMSIEYFLIYCRKSRHLSGCPKVATRCYCIIYKGISPIRLARGGVHYQIYKIFWHHLIYQRFCSCVRVCVMNAITEILNLYIIVTIYANECDVMSSISF